MEGLWAINFVGSTGSYGGGVVVFETQRIFGGDATYYYIGSYDVKNGDVTARVSIIHHSGPLNNIFGPLKRVELEVTGKAAKDSMQGMGNVIGNPAMKVKINFRHLADLP